MFYHIHIFCSLPSLSTIRPTTRRNHNLARNHGLEFFFFFFLSISLSSFAPATFFRKKAVAVAMMALITRTRRLGARWVRECCPPSSHHLYATGHGTVRLCTLPSRLTTNLDRMYVFYRSHDGRIRVVNHTHNISYKSLWRIYIVGIVIPWCVRQLLRDAALLRRYTSLTNACPTEQGNGKSSVSVTIVYLNTRISNTSVLDNLTIKCIWLVTTSTVEIIPFIVQIVNLYSIPGTFIDIIHAHANLITMPPSNVHPQQWRSEKRV